MAFYTLFDQASRGWRGANLAAEEAIFGVALVVSLGLLRMSEASPQADDETTA